MQFKTELSTEILTSDVTPLSKTLKCNSSDAGKATSNNKLKTVKPLHLVTVRRRRR